MDQKLTLQKKFRFVSKFNVLYDFPAQKSHKKSNNGLTVPWQLALQTAA